MRILVVAATSQEIPSLQPHVRNGHQIDVLVTGVGMVATAAHCSRALARARFDLALNLGVCGTFDRSLALGTVVHVVSDRVAELGVEDGDRFVTLCELGLTADGELVNAAPPANPTLERLPRVRGITVNTVHGSDASIAAVMARFDPQVESMEGAAFAYACAINGVPYAQVRAVSNVVERRNRAAWRMDLAVRALNDAARGILEACG
jgi:futalosine hydrolase